MMWTLTIRLNTGGWILHDIQEQVLEAAAQIPWRCLVGIPDCLQLLDGHQLICLRWQACTASHAAKSMQDSAAAQDRCHVVAVRMQGRSSDQTVCQVAGSVSAGHQPALAAGEPT